MWLCGNGKKYEFLLSMIWLGANFHLEISQKHINFKFKALELFYITPMRQNGANKKYFLIKKLIFLLMVFCRIGVMLRRNRASKKKFSGDFWRSGEARRGRKSP